MKPEILYLQAGSLLEIAGLLTWFTNQESFLPHVDMGFEIPALLVSADIQGGLLFIAGSAITTYAVFQMR